MYCQWEYPWLAAVQKAIGPWILSAPSNYKQASRKLFYNSGSHSRCCFRRHAVLLWWCCMVFVLKRLNMVKQRSPWCAVSQLFILFFHTADSICWVNADCYYISMHSIYVLCNSINWVSRGISVYSIDWVSEVYSIKTHMPCAMKISRKQWGKQLGYPPYTGGELENPCMGHPPNVVLPVHIIIPVQETNNDIMAKCQYQILRLVWYSIQSSTWSIDMRRKHFLACIECVP